MTLFPQKTLKLVDGEIADSADPDQTAHEQSDQWSDLGVHCFLRHLYSNNFRIIRLIFKA